MSIAPPSAKRQKTTTPPSQPTSSVAGSSNGGIELLTAPTEAVEQPPSSSTPTASIPISPPTCDRTARRERLSLIKELEDLKAVIKVKDNELMNEKNRRKVFELKYVHKNANFYGRCYATARRNNYRKPYGDLKDRLRLERTDRCLEEVLACCMKTSKIEQVNSSSSISEYMKMNKDLGMQALNLLQSIKSRLDDKLLLPLKYIQHPDVLERIEGENEEIKGDTVANEVAFRLLGEETARGYSRIKKFGK